MSGPGHARDRLLHQRAPEIVAASLEQNTRRIQAELDPRQLHVVDRAGEQQACDGMDPPVLLERRPGPSDAREVDRCELMHERERDELGEAAALLLDPAEELEVRDPVMRLVDMPIHHRRRRRDAERMRGRHDLDPLRRRQLALRQDPADLIIEDLGRGPRDRPEASAARLLEPLTHPDAHLPRTADDLHRAEGMHVHTRHAGLHRVEDPERVVAREVGVDARLDADLGRADRPRLLRTVRDLLERERVRIRIVTTLREGAEAAAHVTDVRRVDVAVHDVGDERPDAFLTDLVGGPRERLELDAGRAEQQQRVRIIEHRPAGREREHARDVTPDARAWRRLHTWRVGRHHALGDRVHVTEHGPVHRVVPVRSACVASVGRVGSAPMTVTIDDRPHRGRHAVRDDDRVLPRLPDRARGHVGQPVPTGERGDRSPHATGEPRVGRRRVLRVDGQPLAEHEPAGLTDRGQTLELGPRRLGVDMVRCHRGHAAPVVDACGEHPFEVIG